MNADKTQIVEVGETDFEAEVLRAKQPVLVLFAAPWSRPCHIIRLVLEELAGACAGRLKVVGVNVDDQLDLGAWYDIQSVPTTVCFINGKASVRIVGTASKEAILTKLEPFLSSNSSVNI